MNLAVSQALSPNRNQEDSDEQNRIAMLKAQNKMLTQVNRSKFIVSINGNNVTEATKYMEVSLIVVIGGIW